MFQQKGIVIASICAGALITIGGIGLGLFLFDMGQSNSPASAPTTDTTASMMDVTAVTVPTTVATTTTTTIPTTRPTMESADGDFVRVLDYIPTAYVDLKYATEDNFTDTVIYDFSEAYLRYGTVKKLMRAQEILQEQGYSLKIWDAFRPVKAQFTLWEVYPNGNYVANPNTGYSSHSRGNTVDVTLVTTDGQAVEMPTEFDDFSSAADRNYSDCTEQAATHAQALQDAMSAVGFSPYYSEWWHFSDTDSYEVEREFSPPSNG